MTKVRTPNRRIKNNEEHRGFARIVLLTNGNDVSV